MSFANRTQAGLKLILQKTNPTCKVVLHEKLTHWLISSDACMIFCDFPANVCEYTPYCGSLRKTFRRFLNSEVFLSRQQNFVTTLHCSSTK